VLGTFRGLLPSDVGETYRTGEDPTGGRAIPDPRQSPGDRLGFGGEGRIAQKEYPVPPNVCVLAQVQMSPAEGSAFAGTAATEATEVMAALSFLKRRKIQSALDQWARNFPQAPPAEIHVGRPSSLALFTVYVVRPFTRYDPILDTLGAPVIPNGTPADDPASARFNAALRLFFPDFALDPTTGAQMTGGRTGSETIYGPFPRNVPFVSSNMVQLAVAVAKMPGAFQPGAGDNGPSFWDTIESAGKTGILATAASHGNIYAGLGAAAAKLVISAFDWLFGGPPQPPAWLTALERMKDLREGNGSPSFHGIYGGGGAALINCTRATITPHGTMTIEQGYDAFLSALGAGKRKIPWLLLGAGGVALYFIARE
jgi:hypothetical protein